MSESSKLTRNAQIKIKKSKEKVKSQELGNDREKLLRQGKRSKICMHHMP